MECILAQFRRSLIPAKTPPKQKKNQRLEPNKLVLWKLWVDSSPFPWGIFRCQQRGGFEKSNALYHYIRVTSISQEVSKRLVSVFNSCGCIFYIQYTVTVAVSRV